MSIKWLFDYDDRLIIWNDSVRTIASMFATSVFATLAFGRTFQNLWSNLGKRSNQFKLDPSEFWFFWSFFAIDSNELPSVTCNNTKRVQIICKQTDQQSTLKDNSGESPGDKQALELFKLNSGKNSIFYRKAYKGYTPKIIEIDRKKSICRTKTFRSKEESPRALDYFDLFEVQSLNSVPNRAFWLKLSPTSN